MGLEEQQIKNEFERFSGRFGPKTILPATVTAINSDGTIAIEFSDESTIDDARLKAVVKEGNKVLLIPRVDSTVLVGKIENSDEYVVIAVDEVSDVIIVIDDMNYHLSGTGILAGVKEVNYSMDETGFLIKKDDDTLKAALVSLIEAVEAIIVIEGRNPDRVKLATAKSKINNILK